VKETKKFASEQECKRKERKQMKFKEAKKERKESGFLIIVIRLPVWFYLILIKSGLTN